MAQMVSYDIPEIDLVIVDLYPFEDTVKSGASDADIIEKIDIGGISLIRAGAKNFKDSVIVASKNQYKPLLDILNERGAETTLEERRWFAKEAFAVSSYYDSCIYNWFAGDEEEDHFRLALDGFIPQTNWYEENHRYPGSGRPAFPGGLLHPAGKTCEIRLLLHR